MEELVLMSIKEGIYKGDRYTLLFGEGKKGSVVYLFKGRINKLQKHIWKYLAGKGGFITSYKIEKAYIGHNTVENMCMNQFDNLNDKHMNALISKILKQSNDNADNTDNTEQNENVRVRFNVPPTVQVIYNFTALLLTFIGYYVGILSRPFAIFFSAYFTAFVLYISFKEVRKWLNDEGLL